MKSGKNRVYRAGIIAGVLCFLRRIRNIDREFRAKSLAEMAAHTAVRSRKDRIVVAFDIKFGRHFQYLARAVVNTEITALAALFNDNYITPADMNFVGIKGFSPEFHTVFSLEVSLC